MKTVVSDPAAHCILEYVNIFCRGGRDVRETFQDVRRRLINNLLNNLRQRFPRADLIEAMQVPNYYRQSQETVISFLCPSQEKLIDATVNISLLDRRERKMFKKTSLISSLMQLGVGKCISS